VATQQQRQRAFDQRAIVLELSGDGESQHPLPRHGAGDTVIQALDGAVQLRPFEDALLPIDLGF